MRSISLGRQPMLGLAGITVVIPLMLVLAVGLGGAERSLLVLGPMSAFSLPVVVTIAFCWNDWPGTLLRPPLTGLVDTLVVIVGGLVFTIAGQAVVAHVDLRGVFDPTAGGGHATTFPGTMPLAGAIFVSVLQFTLVSERWPLRRMNRFAGGLVTVAAGWGVGLVLYEALVADAGGPVSGSDFGAGLVCVAVLQVAFYVVLRGWPFCRIGRGALRLGCANVVVIAGGVGIYLALHRGAGLGATTISALAGAAVAAGLLVGALFDGWLDGVLSPGAARLGNLAGVAVTGVLLYVVLTAYAHATQWTRAQPEEWVSYVGLNAIGLGVLLHVGIGHRWPFTSVHEPESSPERPRRTRTRRDRGRPRSRQRLVHRVLHLRRRSA